MLLSHWKSSEARCGILNDRCRPSNFSMAPDENKKSTVLCREPPAGREVQTFASRTPGRRVAMPGCDNAAPVAGGGGGTNNNSHSIPHVQIPIDSLSMNLLSKLCFELI